MAKHNLKVVPESSDRDTYVISIGPRGFTVQFDADDEDKVLRESCSLILRSARDLMECIRVADQHRAVMDDLPHLGVGLLLHLASALDGELTSREDRAAG